MKMKKNFFLFSFVICGLFISCESPDETENKENNSPPNITVTVNDTLLSPGDTLHLAMHVSDLTLAHGTIDINKRIGGDYVYSIKFNNLNSFLDTTLTHIFNSTGLFSIKVSFSDGHLITTKELNITVSTKPIVFLSLNKTVVYYKDTLVVNLRAAHKTLSSGFIDFDDGTIISFPNLYKRFDTTLTHVYLRLGEHNNITATFHNKDTFTTVSKSIEFGGYYYVLNLSVGMTWRYKYKQTYEQSLNWRAENRTGIHKWEIVSKSNSIFKVQESINDTVHIKNISGLDTSYTINATRNFIIEESYSNIKFILPYGNYGNSEFNVPNHTYVASYPLTVSGGVLEGTIICEDKVGITSYNFYFQDRYWIQTQGFSLIDYSLP